MKLGVLAVFVLLLSAGGSLADDKSEAFEEFLAGCKLGSAEYCFYVGWSYKLGDGVEKDPTEAFNYLKKACEGGYEEACPDLRKHSEMPYKLAASASKGGDHEYALRYYLLACRYELPAGCLQASSYFLNGLGTEKDEAEAAILAALAKGYAEEECNSGRQISCLALGQWWFNGMAGPVDEAEALIWFEKGCEADFEHQICDYLREHY